MANDFTSQLPSANAADSKDGRLFLAVLATSNLYLEFSRAKGFLTFTTQGLMAKEKRLFWFEYICDSLLSEESGLKSRYMQELLSTNSEISPETLQPFDGGFQNRSNVFSPLHLIAQSIVADQVLSLSTLSNCVAGYQLWNDRRSFGIAFWFLIMLSQGTNDLQSITDQGSKWRSDRGWCFKIYNFILIFVRSPGGNHFEKSVFRRRSVSSIIIRSLSFTV